MKIQLFGYDQNTYGDLDDAQEDGAIYLLCDEAKSLTLATFNLTVKESIESTKVLADKEIAVFIKAGGMDHSHESICHDLEQNHLLTVEDIAKAFRSEFETDFKHVRAKISWLSEPQSFEIVTICNTSQYLDLAACDFCGECKNCKHDESIHYYADCLTELDELMEKPHDDGWEIESYSVTDDTKDLFKFHGLQPVDLKKICSKYDDTSLTYEECNKFLKQVEKLGYTFKFGLDGIPYSLHLKLSS